MTRRICAALACLALGLGLLAGCAGQPKTTVSDNAQRFTAYYFDVFDTMTQVIAYCDSQAEFDRQMEALHADLVAYHQLYDIYNDYEGLNNIKTINDNAGVAPVKVDQRIIDMLELAVEMYDTTGGKLNVAMGSVLAVWHDYREAAEADPSDADNRLPTQEELDAAAQHCDISDLIIDREAGTVYLADPEMRLDVGSVGKGYAVEQVCLAAKERGLVSLSLSVGGNLRSVGTKPRGESWESGIVSPWDDSLLYGSSSSLLAAVRSNDQALVTSGDYQRFYTVDGVRYHHIIDPDTLWPADYFTAVTILCPDSGLADCLSTGIFCMPLEEGMALIESLDGVEALWCTKDGQIIKSSGFEQYEIPLEGLNSTRSRWKDNETKTKSPRPHIVTRRYGGGGCLFSFLRLQLPFHRPPFHFELLLFRSAGFLRHPGKPNQWYTVCLPHLPDWSHSSQSTFELSAAPASTESRRFLPALPKSPALLQTPQFHLLR